MKRYRRTLRVLAAIMIGLLAAIPMGRPQTAAADIDPDVVDRVYPAVVQLGPIAEIVDDQGEKTIRFLGWGSGTIVHPDGFILTNSHVVDVSDLIAQLEDEGRSDVTILEGKMAVFITADTDNPPIPTYIADVVVDAPELDLAVVKVTEDLSGHDLSGEELGLPFVPLGDSSQLRLGQEVHIFGYPAIGGETITFTSGAVSGFSFEAGVEGRAWIKTSATISGGNSGGTAVDDSGNLIGVPTQGGSGNNPDIVDCRRLVDTNGDGVINEEDSCVPFGGFINALRPVNLALPLIAQATSGIGPPPTELPNTPTTEPIETPETTSTPGTPGTPSRTATPGGATPTATTTTGTGEASVSRMFVANGVDDSGYPLSVVTSLPSGSPNVVAYFDYSGFETGALWQMRAFVNGDEVLDAWPLSEWDAEYSGSAGIWWFGWLEAEGLPDGTYQFQVDYNGETLATTSIEMGGPDEPKPMFSNVTFSSGDETGNFLTAGLESLTANFEAANMGSEDWQAIWYQRDDAGTWNEIFSTDEESWAEEATGQFTTEFEADAPLTEGTYRVELTIDGQLSGTSDVWLVGGNNNNTGLFGPITFGDGQDEDGNATNPGTEFPDPTFELYAVWEYEGMEDGLDWNLKWLLDGELIVDQDQIWDGGETGTWSSYLYMTDGEPLPVGQYEVQLSIQGELIQTATATIGDIANRPTPTPTPSLEDSVIIKGTITDATTGQPIENAIFVVLAEGVTWDTFEDSAEQILDLAFTDADGQFTLFTPLPRGKSFSMGSFAEGYQPSVQDGVEITNELPATVEIEIALEQQ